jgi:PAS domain S-box-containing protein
MATVGKRTPAYSSANEARGMFGEGPHALLSVLQELTVAALELFDPKRSPDVFLDRLAERLGCYAAVLFEIHPGARVSLQSAAGLSTTSRSMPIPADAARAIAQRLEDYELPYPELHRASLVRWSFPVVDPDPASASLSLLLCFDGEPPPKQLHGMAQRLARILQTVLVHRNLFARTIESERRLDEQKTLLECVSDVSMDAILVIGGDGRALFHNRRFVEAWGLEGEIVSRSSAAILDEMATRVEDPETFLERTRRLLQQQDTEFNDEIQLRDGRVFARHRAPVKNAAGTSYGQGIYYRDITERKRAEAERERLLATEQAARAAAEEAIHARDEFLSIASHELRTPLTSVQLVIQFALRNARREPAPTLSLSQGSLELIERQMLRLNKLIEALLDVSRIQAGRLELELEATDLLAVTREVLSRFGDELKRSGSTLSLDAEAQVLGKWDRSRLDQVVTNLLSNAIKYGRGNPIEVSVETWGERARLVVRDHGLGIPREHMPQMFKRFERAVSARSYGGLGLGLYIVHQIVEMHGGSVSVESELGVGSSFTVELPLRGPGASGE